MPRYFFDIHDDQGRHHDEEGTDLAGPEEARKEARRILPDIARHDVAGDGDRRSFVVMVRDEAGRPVYSATLSYAGLWLTP